jgi:predicted  nucleic acid-binding Zn-ribbon protein
MNIKTYQEMRELKKEISSLKTHIAGLESELNELRGEDK